MKILLTGAVGFVGSHLMERLAQHEVIALARAIPEGTPAKHVQWLQHDLTSPFDSNKFPKQIDTIIHLAQSRHFRDFPEQAADIFDVNVRSTFHLLNYARQAGVVRFIYASSGGVYGNKDDNFLETDQVNPLSFYLTSKYVSELLVGTYRQYFQTLTARLFFAYGARQNDTMLIPRLVRSVYQQQPILLQSINGIRINPIYIGDVVEALFNAIRIEDHAIVNIAGPEVLSIREIATIIGDHIHMEPVFDVQPNQTPTHLTGDISRMSSLLHKPQKPFRDGVIEVCEEIFHKLN